MSWRGAAEPRSAATGAGKPGTSGTRSRPAGVRSSGMLGVERLGEDRRRPDVEHLRSPQQVRGTPGALGTTLALGQDQDQGARRVDGGQVAVEECLQVAVRGRDPRPFLDLEDELAAGRAVASGGDHEQPVCVREPCRDPLGGGGLIDAARDEIGGRLRVERPARDVRPDSREREDRRQVADDVAPVLVELLAS